MTGITLIWDKIKRKKRAFACFPSKTILILSQQVATRVFFYLSRVGTYQNLAVLRNMNISLYVADDSVVSFGSERINCGIQNNE